jgi:hypothetical protein
METGPMLRFLGSADWAGRPVSNGRRAARLEGPLSVRAWRKDINDVKAGDQRSQPDRRHKVCLASAARSLDSGCYSAMQSYLLSRGGRDGQ